MVYLKKLLLCCVSIALFASLSAIAQNVIDTNKNALPEIGVVASDAIPLDKEIVLGKAIMRQMRGQAPLVMDPVLDEYLTDLGNRLVVHSENTKFPFSFFWVNNSAINAFAFFGGHIGVHTGLIAKADTESEFASVLTHEIAHVTQRHIARRVQAQERASPLAIASAIGGLLLAIANPQAGMAAMQVGQAASAQMQIDYTRSNEQEADRIGIAALARAGFDPDGAASFFSTLAAEYRMRSRPPARLLTHPLTETRVADARARAAEYPQRRLRPSLAFNLARARVLARYEFDAVYATEYFTAAIKKQAYAIEDAAQYGLALALMRIEEYEQAKDILDRLLAKSPSNLFYLDAATDVSIAQSKFDEAIERLRPHFELTPKNAVLALNMANAMISAEKYDDAISVIKDFLLVSEEHQIAYQLLHQAYKESNRYMDMHQAQAELFALYGAYPRAVDELQYAYNFAEDDYLSRQRIRARILQFREQEQRLKQLQ